jgi:hypothetical protein
LKRFINKKLLANFNTVIPAELVEIAFGRRSFPPNSGLFYVVNVQEPVVPENRITVVRLHNPERNDAVPGAQFTMARSTSFSPSGHSPPDHRTITFQHRDGSKDDVRFLHHPARFTFASGNIRPSTGESRSTPNSHRHAEKTSPKTVNNDDALVDH